MTGIEAIAELFAGPGARDYMGEPVTIGIHMRQAGALAQAAGAHDTLVAAALLHDIGHLRNEPDARHGDDAAARHLADGAGPAGERQELTEALHPRPADDHPAGAASRRDDPVGPQRRERLADGAA